MAVLLALAIAAPSEEGFARYLLAEGEPELAMGVYQRLVDLEPAAVGARRALFRLYLDQGKLEAARKLADEPLLQADLAAAAGEAGAAFTGYSRLVRQPATRRVALRRLIGLALQQRWWAQAITSAEALAAEEHAESLRQLAGELRAWRERERLSAERARLLSALLPGSGQLYAGQPAAALGSLGVNAAFGGAVLWAARAGDWVGAGSLIGLGSRYYFGGIQHAERYVEARLAAEELAFVRRLRDERPWLAL